jgi:chromosomal replication initiator protein
MKMMHPYAYVGCKNFAFHPQTLSNEMKENLVMNIINGVANFYKIEKWDIIGQCREEQIVIPRHVAVYMSLKMTGISLVRLGKILGGRHHSTIMNSRDYIIGQLEEKNQTPLKEDIRQLKYIL